MNCSHIEDLLSRYVEDDVSEEERGIVDSHVAACSACAESLADYQRLEGLLVARSELRPPPRDVRLAVLDRVGMARRPWWAVIWPLPAPAAASAVFVTLGIVMLVFRDAVAKWVDGALPREGSAAGFGDLLHSMGQGVVAFAGANQVAVMAIHFGVFGLVFLTGSLFVMKFVRD